MVYVGPSIPYVNRDLPELHRPERLWKVRALTRDDIRMWDSPLCCTGDCALNDTVSFVNMQLLVTTECFEYTVPLMQWWSPTVDDSHVADDSSDASQTTVGDQQ